MRERKQKESKRNREINGARERRRDGERNRKWRGGGWGGFRV